MSRKIPFQTVSSLSRIGCEMPRTNISPPVGLRNLTSQSHGATRRTTSRIDSTHRSRSSGAMQAVYRWNQVWSGSGLRP